jgi:hypothetical protein
MDRFLFIFKKVHLALAPPADPAPGPSHTDLTKQRIRNFYAVITSHSFFRLSAFNIDVIGLRNHNDSFGEFGPRRPMIRLNRSSLIDSLDS